jgi:hypothetical protein
MLILFIYYLISNRKGNDKKIICFRMDFLEILSKKSVLLCANAFI